MAFALSLFLRPRSAQCPPRMWLNGVRPDGLYQCLRVPLGDDSYTRARGERDPSIQPAGSIDGRIYCRSGERALVLDWHRAGCRP